MTTRCNKNEGRRKGRYGALQGEKNRVLGRKGKSNPNEMIDGANRRHLHKKRELKVEQGRGKEEGGVEGHWETAML